MIHMFRKEIRKWYIVLWVILLSLGLSSLAYIFRGGSSFERARIAKVNGENVSFKDFKLALAETQLRLDYLRRMAQMFGLSEAALLKQFYATSNPQEIALKTAIKEKLLDQAKAHLHISIQDEDLMESLMSSLPEGMVDERGRLNMGSYQQYLKHLGMSAEDYEARKEAEMGRQVLEQIVLHSFFFPKFAVPVMAAGDQARKSFNAVQLATKDFISQAKQAPATKDELQKTYARYKQNFYVEERRQARFWKIDQKSYAKNISISEDAIADFYEKNKTSQFRIAPKVKISRLLVKEEALAHKLHKEIKENPALFASKVKELSEDKETVFVAPGTLEKAEDVAAFRLLTPGDISEVVTCSRGFEIFRLEERLNASVKPLDEVRETIAKTLGAKRALDKLKSDLEILMHDAKENDALIEAFAAERRISGETLWVQKEHEKKSDLEAKLVERLFSKSKKTATQGYFLDGSTYVLYQSIQVEPGYTRSFDDVASEVAALFYEDKAQELMAQAVQEVKNLMKQGKSLSQAAQEAGFSVSSTGLVRKTDAVSVIKDFSTIAEKAFLLSDPSLILQQKNSVGTCLVQLDRNEDAGKDDESIQSELKTKFARLAHQQMNSFIASLERTAKIERFDTRPSTTAASDSIE